METMKILTPEQIRNVEKIAISEYNLTADILMENAAHAMFREIQKRYKGFKICIICGPGNNGGDGFAIGRILFTEGWDVSISLLKKSKYVSASLRNYKSVEKLGLICSQLPLFDEKTLIIDAIFGIGLNRALEPETEILIEKINNSISPVLSVDIPSGIDGLTGNIMGKHSIIADLTVTFITPKQGHFNFPGADHCGELITSKISIPQVILKEIISPQINSPVILKNRDRNIHKGSYGKVLTIAGSSKYFGAPYFVSKSVLLAGSGYSTLITTPDVAKSCATLAPEVIYREEKDIPLLIKVSSAVVFGPGIGINDRGRSLFKVVLNNSPEKLIIDGDGLSLLSEDLNVIKGFSGDCILTPHPKEMSKLLKVSINDIEKNRVGYALKLSKELKCYIVLKGVYTVISTPTGNVYINTNSSNTLATAGSGDILSGIIASLTGYTTTENAVRAGVFIHGSAGILAEIKIGKIGVTSSDLIKEIPLSVNNYHNIRNT